MADVIFIHSSFRTSSTYIWSLLRRNSGVIAYYEIFNEFLNEINIDNICFSSYNSWHSNHPSGAPYFLEYTPLLRKGGGVSKFDLSFSYGRFIPLNGPMGEISDKEQEYVFSLIRHAEERNKIPVLTATRSLGRLAGLKSTVPGFHVIVYRNLMQQWCSYTEQAIRGNRGFLKTVLDIPLLNNHDSTMSEIATLFPISEPCETDVNTFFRFIFIHIYLYTNAASTADLILDINRASDEIAYRREIEDLFSEMGVPIDLSGTQKSISHCLVDVCNVDEFIETVKVFGHTIVDRTLSRKGRDFGAYVIEDFIKEYLSYDFFTRSIQEKLSQALKQCAITRSELDLIRYERDSLLAERPTANTA